MSNWETALESGRSAHAGSEHYLNAVHSPYGTAIRTNADGSYTVSFAGGDAPQRAESAEAVDAILTEHDKDSEWQSA